MKRILFLLTTTLLLSACTTTPDTTPTITILEEDTLQPSTTPSLTTEPTIFVPVTDTPRPTTAPRATITPLPIIPEAEQVELLQELFSLNEFCRLPCWWGLEPRKAEFEEWIKIVTFFGNRTAYPSNPNVTKYYHAWEFPLYDEVKISINYGVKDEKLNNIIVMLHPKLMGQSFRGISSFEGYSLSNIMEIYGMPSRVMIGNIRTVHADPGPPYADYDIWVFYDHLGFSIFYRGPYRFPGAGEDTLTFCLTYENIEMIGLYLQSPEDQVRLEKLVAVRYGYPVIEERIADGKILGVEEATGMDITEFTSFMSDPANNLCFPVFVR
jgi:hypothetical protein